MNPTLILQLIIAITTYCSGPGVIVRHNTITSNYNRQCFKEIWECGHIYTNSEAIVRETDRCISEDLNAKVAK